MSYSGRRTDILSCGLLVYDILVSPVDASVFESDTFKIENMAFSVGGDAMNVAVDSAKLGASVALSGIVGNDAPGKYLTETARSIGVDVGGVTVKSDLSTACSVVLGEEGGARHFAYYGKPNYLYDGTDVTDEMLENTAVLYVGSVMGLDSLAYGNLETLFKRAKSFGCVTAMDATTPPDGVWLPRIERSLAFCDIFIPSLDEAVKISGRDTPEDVISFLHGRGVKIAGVKLGKQGVAVEDVREPAYRCDNIAGTTGAGDGFMSGFITGYVMGKSVRECTELGSAVSNCVIRKPGATDGVESIEKCYEVISAEKSGTLI